MKSGHPPSGSYPPCDSYYLKIQNSEGSNKTSEKSTTTQTPSSSLNVPPQKISRSTSPFKFYRSRNCIDKTFTWTMTWLSVLTWILLKVFLAVLSGERVKDQPSWLYNQTTSLGAAVARKVRSKQKFPMISLLPHLLCPYLLHNMGLWLGNSIKRNLLLTLSFMPSVRCQALQWHLFSKFLAFYEYLKNL